MRLRVLLAASFKLTSLSLAALSNISLAAAQPTAKLDSATIVGIADGTVSQFLGIPFAEPPVGSLRLQIPEPITSYSGTINATTYAPICVQQGPSSNSSFNSIPASALAGIATTGVPLGNMAQSEDCLNLNVIVPANATPDSLLPVAVWIFGGGWQAGYSNEWPGENLVARSIEMGYPMIFVAMNYRLSVLGFLGGKEVKDAGVANLGLHDQRVALQWVNKYISGFGGDPEKVMIFGQSAGSFSVAQHMLANGGDPEGLFRAAFMLSGNAPPTGDVDSPYMQETFDGVVERAGCQGQSDPLDCLRSVPLENIVNAMADAPTLFGSAQACIPWAPHVDGNYVAQIPELQVTQGIVAKVPFITGNVFDEGTLFSYGTLNVTTDDEFLDYLQSSYFKNTSRDDLMQVLDLYPSDPAAGSPFDTGDSFAVTPQFKRMAAFQGDYVFQAPRRLFIQQLSSSQPAWAYVNKMPEDGELGVPHTIDLIGLFGGSMLGDYLIRFAATLDPNGDGAVEWPQYSTAEPQLLWFNGTTEDSLSLEPDTYRMAGMKYLTTLGLADPF